jgi:hypothetical protein
MTHSTHLLSQIGRLYVYTHDRDTHNCEYRHGDHEFEERESLFRDEKRIKSQMDKLGNV